MPFDPGRHRHCIVRLRLHFLIGFGHDLDALSRVDKSDALTDQVVDPVLPGLHSLVRLPHLEQDCLIEQSHHLALPLLHP